MTEEKLGSLKFGLDTSWLEQVSSKQKKDYSSAENYHTDCMVAPTGQRLIINSSLTIASLKKYY